MYIILTTKRTPKNMTICSKNRCYQNHVPVNRIVFIITMVLACASQLCGPSLATDRNAGHGTDCWQSVTCAQCAARPSCSWSLRPQACAGTSATSGRLRVHEPAACPSFTAVNRFVAASDRAYAYALRVRNAPPGFMEFLAQAKIRCDVAGVKLDGRVSGDLVECASTPVAGLWPRPREARAKGVGDGDENDDDDDDDDDDHGPVIVRHARVTIAGGRVTLRPDVVSDGYFAASRLADCGPDGWDAACVTCARHDTAGTEYFVRCAGRNRCTAGLFEYRDAWPPRPRRRRWRPDATRAHDDDDDDDAPLSCGRDVRVRSVEPARAPWTGGGTLRVTVSDRGVLSEKAAVSVTVAGRPCAGLTVVPGDDAAQDSVMTCVLPPAAGTDGPPDGSAAVAAVVRVRYQVNRTLELVAAGPAFRYAYPEVTAVERAVRFGPRANGSAEAGAEWTVRGSWLDAGRGVRVSVGADDAHCELVARPSADRIACFAAGGRGDGADRLTAEFDGGLRVHAVLWPRWAVYVGEPAVDAGQTFRALASGDTALTVRGRRLLYAEHVRLYAGAAGGAALGACRVLNDTCATCAAPRLDDAAADATGAVGLLMDFAGRRDFRAPAAAASYRAYPDPVFADFETDAASGTITVHGGGPEVAYWADDLTVRWYSTAADGGDGDGGERCVVIDVSADRIVCAQSSPPEVLERARSVVVGVGGRLRVRIAVARDPADRAGPAVASGFAHSHLWTVLTLALIAVLAGAAAQVGLMRRRASMRRKRREERSDAATAAAAAAAATTDSREASYCSVRLTSSPCSSVDLTI